MSNFFTAFSKTMRVEGGVNFNPDDQGNMVVNGICILTTYKGIAPQIHLNWQGWKIVKEEIDSLGDIPIYGTRTFKKWCGKLNASLTKNEQLQNLVLQFYKANFWDANRLGEIQDQDVANWIYDHAVNGGGRGITWMQEAAGVKGDGSIGPRTLAAINAADPEKLLQTSEDVAAFYRLDRAARDPSQIQFLPSWLRRDGVSEEEIREVMQAAKDGLTYTEVAALKRLIQSTV